MLLAPGTRFAKTNTWTIDVNDYGDRYYYIFHVVRATAKTVLVHQATLYHGDVNVDGNALMDKVVQAHLSNIEFVNHDSTTPARYKLHTRADGTQCFYINCGTQFICLKGRYPVTYIRTGALAVTGKKRARPPVVKPFSAQLVA